MPTRADLAIYQGDDWAAAVTVDGVDDLTGYTPKAQIRLGVADLNEIIVVEIEATLDAETLNQINLLIPHDITVQLSGLYVWDLQVTDTNDIVTTLLAGAVTVTQEVTRVLPGLLLQQVA